MEGGKLATIWWKQSQRTNNTVMFHSRTKPRSVPSQNTTWIISLNFPSIHEHETTGSREREFENYHPEIYLFFITFYIWGTEDFCLSDWSVREWLFIDYSQRSELSEYRWFNVLYIYLANNCLGFFFNVEMSVSRTTPQQRFKEGGTCDSVVFVVSFLEKLLNTQTFGVVIRETFS